MVTTLNSNNSVEAGLFLPGEVGSSSGNIQQPLHHSSNNNMDNNSSLSIRTDPEQALECNYVNGKQPKEPYLIWQGGANGWLRCLLCNKTGWSYGWGHDEKGRGVLILKKFMKVRGVLIF